MEAYISFSLTTYNRFDFTIECINSIINDERIGEIICSDDCSTDGSFELLKIYYKNNSKVKIFQNDKNVDCYICKYLTISRCSFDYCIIADSDNSYSKAYIDAIYNEEWDEKVIFAPSFAKPTFDYRAFSGLTITKENINEYFDKPMFSTMLNTMNFFINRKQYLDIWDGEVNPVTADSIYFNYCWLAAGNKIKVVEGMEYEHLVHSGSHYVNNVSRTGNFYEEVETKIKNICQ